MTRALVAAIALTRLVCCAPAADAQILKEIGARAVAKVAEKKARADSALAGAASRMVDSTLERADRGAEAVVAKTSGVIDTVLGKTERGLSRAFTAGARDGADALGRQLAAGRAVLVGVRFAGGGDALDPSAAEYLSQVAAQLAAMTGAFLVEGHVASSGDDAADQALAERRAASVKAALIAQGISAVRLFSVGVGSSRPPAGARAGDAATARIELVRMQ